MWPLRVKMRTPSSVKARLIYGQRNVSFAGQGLFKNVWIKKIDFYFLCTLLTMCDLIKTKAICLRMEMNRQIPFSNSFNKTVLKQLVRTLQFLHDKLLTRACVSVNEHSIIFLKSASNKYHITIIIIILIIIIAIIVKEFPLLLKELYHWIERILKMSLNISICTNRCAQRRVL